MSLPRSRRYSIVQSDFPEAALTPEGICQLSGKLNVKIASLAYIAKAATLTTSGKLSIGNETYDTKSILATKFRWIEASEVVDVKLKFVEGKLTLRFTGIKARLVTNQGKVKSGIQLASDKQDYDFYKLLGRLIGGKNTAPVNDDSLLDASLFSTVDTNLTGLNLSETSFWSGGRNSPAFDIWGRESPAFEIWGRESPAFDIWKDPFEDVESPVQLKTLKEDEEKKSNESPETAQMLKTVDEETKKPNKGCQDIEMMKKVMLGELPWPGDDVVWGWLPGAIPPSK